MKEIWKPSKYFYQDGTFIDFTGLYETSSHGRIKHLPHIRLKRGVNQLYKEKVTDFSNYKTRYIDTYLWKDGIKYKIQLHRLVLSTFKPDSETYECVNHKDYNTHNNKLSNLEWCTYTYNNNYGDRNEKLSKSLTNQLNITGGCKITLQYDLNGNLIKEWPSASEAARFYNVNRCNIISCCLGKNKSSNGFLWKYK